MVQGHFGILFFYQALRLQTKNSLVLKNASKIYNPGQFGRSMGLKTYQVPAKHFMVLAFLNSIEIFRVQLDQDKNDCSNHKFHEQIRQ